MKIRTQLVTLVAGVMAPLVLLMAFVTYSLWHQQRQAYEQRYLERVSALRLALDAELDGIVGSLASAIAPTELSTPDLEAALQRRFSRLLASHPDWSAAVWVDPTGRELVGQRRADTPAAVILMPAQLEQAIRGREPLVTGLSPIDGSRFMTYIAVPVIQGDSVQGVVYAAIEHAHWLRFLSTYPISAHATLTLNDPLGNIIARTLNDSRWVGQRSTSSYLDRTVGKNEGVFTSSGLEGQVFYSAFSRSRRAGWLLGTGVPRQEVEAALFNQTLLISFGTALALMGALAAAWLLGRHINTSLTSLERSAVSWPRSTEQHDVPLPIREAETVRLALMESGQRMRSHEDSLTASVQREAAAREAAESGSRSKDAFLAMLGHELRNPLSAITTAMAVLSSPTMTPDAAARTREILARQTTQLRQMLGDLIETAELTKGHVTLQKTRIDLAELVARVITRFIDIGKCGHMQLRQELHPTLVEADSQRLEQVVTQLLENACRYTPAGGTVSIDVRETDSCAVLEISDNGIGIAPGLLAQVFDLFAQGERTIERAQGGLGVGLAAVKSLVELHGGSVQAKSEGEGAEPPSPSPCQAGWMRRRQRDRTQPNRASF